MEVIYNKLLKEAKQSPLILSDLAGLESYISESYTNRSFIELLQNADDAHSTHFLVEKYNGYLIIANNGRCFNELDIISLCRSASSSKVRGRSIGYRGIGFKSVVSIAEEVHLISGDYELTFSRELTSRLIPEANRVPLIRIPHIIRESVKNQLNDIISRLKEDKYTTFFIFSGVTIEQIKDEYEQFSHTSLLFLRNIKQIHIKLDCEIITEVIELDKNDEYRDVRIISSNKKTEWKIFSKFDCSLVFSIVEGNISRLKQQEAKLHAFLPTDDTTGMGVLINADFSTEPSRRHLIYDENTLDAIDRIAKLYALLLEKYITKIDYNHLIVEALLPYYDIRLVHLTNNTFYKQFSMLLKKYLTALSLIKLPPTWLNLPDFSKLYDDKINYECFRIQNIETFFKYFDCKIATNEELLDKVGCSDISIVGCAEIVSDCVKKLLLNIRIAKFTDYKLFSSGDKICSLQYINDNNLKIDSYYLNLLQEKGISKQDLGIYLKKYCLNNIIELLDLESDQQECNVKNNKVNEQLNPRNNSSKDLNKINYTVKIQPKWRSVEENTLYILNSNGFNLKDVSKCNVGYDLEGFDSDGKDIFIEIKSIEFKGQAFKLTNNEFAVAQQKQDSYYVLLVNQQLEFIEFNWIKNPVKNLILDRRCVQWVWFCDEYEYKPQIINIK